MSAQAWWWVAIAVLNGFAVVASCAALVISGRTSTLDAETRALNADTEEKLRQTEEINARLRARVGGAAAAVDESNSSDHRSDLPGGAR